MTVDLLNITGIVVGQVSHNKYYVWCQESYPGKDGFLTVETQKPVNIGDWVELKFTIEEFQKYFPNPKNKNAEQFRTTKYAVLPKLHDTFVEGKSIKIRLELALLENQQEICHRIFGVIYNNRNFSFKAGDHLVTIKRIAPQPTMNSVWVLDSVDPLPLEVNLIGIVGGSDNIYWYVWTQERPVGLDITIKRGGASLILGSWVKVAVPRDKLKSHHFLESEKYTVIPEIHETEVVNKTIGLVLQCHISDGTLIQHPFVGPIINENFKIKNEGLYEIRIVRKKPKLMKNGEKSVWFLDGEPRLLQASSPIAPSRVDEPRNIPSRPPSRNSSALTSELTGIIVAQNTKHLFIWCKERLPGFDVKIEKSKTTASLDLTDYIKFTVSDEQKTIFFPPRMPENGHYPEFELSQYRKVPAEFPTFTGGPNNTTIHMKMEVEIQQRHVANVFHEFVGIIINDRNLCFETPGTYRITIVRIKKGALPKCVWYLKHRELVSSLSQSRQNLTLSMENLNLAPKLKPILKYSHLQSQMNKLGSLSDNSLYLTEKSAISEDKKQLLKEEEQREIESTEIINHLKRFTSNFSASETPGLSDFRNTLQAFCTSAISHCKARFECMQFAKNDGTKAHFLRHFLKIESEVLKFQMRRAGEELGDVDSPSDLFPQLTPIRSIVKSKRIVSAYLESLRNDLEDIRGYKKDPTLLAFLVLSIWNQTRELHDMDVEVFEHEDRDIEIEQVHKLIRTVFELELSSSSSSSEHSSVVEISNIFENLNLKPMDDVMKQFFF